MIGASLAAGEYALSSFRGTLRALMELCESSAGNGLLVTASKLPALKPGP
jgi:hypothetical protein